MSYARLFVIAPLVLGLTVAFAAAPDPAPTKEEIARWVQQLGDGSFAVREEATQKLWKAGRAAEEAIRAAAKSDDPEIARRAKDLVEKFKWGIYADTPPKVADLINRYQTSDINGKTTIIKDLFDQGSPGVVALIKISAAEDNAEVRRTLHQIINLEAGRAVPMMLAEGNTTALDELLELTVVGDNEASATSYAAYHLLRGKLDEKITQWKPRIDQADFPRAAEVLVQLHRAKGDLDAARQVAEKANRGDLVDGILYEQRNWKELAQRRIKDADPTAEGLGHKAAFLRLAGGAKNQEELKETLAQISKLVENSENDAEFWQAAKVLFINNRPQEALALLTKGRNLVSAFEILIAQAKPREALELAEKVPEGPDRLAVDVLRGRTLYLLGEKDKAKEIFAKLAEQIREGNEGPWQESLIQWEWRIGLREQAVEHCIRALAISKNPPANARLLEKIFPRQGETASGWWQFLQANTPNAKPAEAMKRLREIIAGKMEAKELTVLAEEMERWAQQLPPVERERALLAAAEVCRIASLETQARGYFEKAAAVQGSSAAILKLGDFLAEKKSWEQAAEQYGKAWEKDRKVPLPLYLRGHALIQAGLEKEGKKLIEQSHWLPLGNENQRFLFIDELNKRGFFEAGREERDLLFKTSRPGSFYSGEVMRQRGVEAFAKKDYGPAADYNELAMLRVLRSNVNFNEVAAYVALPHFVHRMRARSLVTAGKLDEARKEIDLCLLLQPGNIELAVLVVPELEKQGHKKEAEELFNKLLALHEKQCKEYPGSATNHNSIGWMLACCRKQLDKALEHATKGVELAPDNASHLDTLAEVYFQRGDKEKAIELMKKCMEIEPKRVFFRKQMKRFEAGDPKVDVPSPTEDE